MRMKCDVCNELDQTVGQPCSFCDEIVGHGHHETDIDLYDEFGSDDEDDEDDELPTFEDVPFSEMVLTDGD